MLENNTTELLNHLLKKPGQLGNSSQLAARWDYYTKILMGLARNPGRGNSSGDFIHSATTAFNNFTVDLSSLIRRRDDPSRLAITLLAYTLIVCVSLFGNLLVCHVVLRTRRLHTLTNTFLANLALSDLLMTGLNIPFNLARMLLNDWPFGRALCSLVPFIQVTSVYVSAFTMVAIAVDRYQVIVHPLKPRLDKLQGSLIILLIWVLAALVSVPYAVYNQVVEVFTYRRLTRCQARYPTPALEFRRWLTLGTFLTQYAIPLFVTAVAYIGVFRRVWWRDIVGTTTREQQSIQLRTKKKTVKMLLIVVVLFALCWLPLNAYHLVVDFSSSMGPTRHSSTVFFICHWFAMSNVCYNPFIYCWLNDHFRAGARAWLFCAARKICRVKIPEHGGDLEPRGVPLTRPQNSLTLSSALMGGSVRSKVGGSQRCNRSNVTASAFHVALDERIESATPGNRTQRNSFPSTSPRSQGQIHGGSMKASSSSKYKDISETYNGKNEYANDNFEMTKTNSISSLRQDIKAEVKMPQINMTASTKHVCLNNVSESQEEIYVNRNQDVEEHNIGKLIRCDSHEF